MKHRCKQGMVGRVDNVDGGDRSFASEDWDTGLVLAQ